jgi:hypothetical protein
MKVKCKCLRIHHDPDNGREYQLFDRNGELSKTLKYSFHIYDLPPVKTFGFCPIDTDDVTLDFGRVVTLNLVKTS